MNIFRNYNLFYRLVKIFHKRELVSIKKLETVLQGNEISISIPSMKDEETPEFTIENYIQNKQLALTENVS